MVDLATPEQFPVQVIASIPGLPSDFRGVQTVSVARTGSIAPVAFQFNALGARVSSLATSPINPAPLQSYSAASEMHCSDGTAITMRVVGTDGYTASVSCPSFVGSGVCTMGVPGGAGGVQDRITVLRGSTVLREIGLVF
jgi:hypothetical protein